MRSVGVLLSGLVGEWRGTGKAFFPTIPTFQYRDSIVVRKIGRSALHYLKMTWKKTPDGEAESHRETGFITFDEDGGIEMLGAHGTDRFEVLRGHLEHDPERVRLDLHSVLVAHDPRIARSWRRIVVTGDTLAYTMGMATTAVPKGEGHLEATLTRV